MESNKVILSSAILVALTINVQAAPAACDEMSTAATQHLKEIVNMNGTADTESTSFVVGKSSDTESYPLFTKNCLNQPGNQVSKNKHDHSNISLQRGA